MPIRTFSLKSEEAHEALCTPRESHRWGPGLPKEPGWPRKPADVWVSAETGDEAAEAFAEWMGHLEAGRV